MAECNKTSPQSHEALLSSADGFTAFSFGGYNIRFRAPYSLDARGTGQRHLFKWGV